MIFRLAEAGPRGPKHSPPSFVSNVGRATISGMKVPDFEAFSGGGEIHVDLASLSEFPSQFQLGVQCARGVTPGPVESVFLKAKQGRVVIISVHARSKDKAAGECTVNLMDVKGRLLDTKSVEFTVTPTVERTSMTGVDWEEDGNAKRGSAYKVSPSIVEYVRK